MSFGLVHLEGSATISLHVRRPGWSELLFTQKLGYPLGVLASRPWVIRGGYKWADPVPWYHRETCGKSGIFKRRAQLRMCDKKALPLSECFCVSKHPAETKRVVIGNMPAGRNMDQVAKEKRTPRRRQRPTCFHTS